MNESTLQQLQADPKPTLTRRRFMQSLLVTWTLASGLPWRFASATQHTASEDTPPWLQAVTGEPHAVTRIGKSYLVAHPEEQGADVLMGLIDEALGRMPGFDSSRPLQPQQIALELKRLVRTEYINDDVIRLEGWILSRTETRLYALVAALGNG
jgi:hypothetical protein